MGPETRLERMGEPRLLRGGVNFGGGRSGQGRVSGGKEVCCDWQGGRTPCRAQRSCQERAASEGKKLDL